MEIQITFRVGLLNKTKYQTFILLKVRCDLKVTIFFFLCGICADFYKAIIIKKF